LGLNLLTLGYLSLLCITEREDFVLYCIFQIVFGRYVITGHWFYCNYIFSL